MMSPLGEVISASASSAAERNHPMSAPTPPASAHPRRWAILAVLSIAQLMVVLDATVVNIALPSAQHALHFSDGDRQWIVTAYSLAFGSLLLIGGAVPPPGPRSN